MIFCVFSFNRGEFLQNCIDSIEHCAPQSSIIVFDDNSVDPKTIQILHSIRSRHKVIQHDHRSRHHLGGLYGNMQSALDYCKDEELVCFLQDDTQLIRPITDNDITVINQTFEQLPKLGFIHPCFIRGINKFRGAHYEYSRESNLYFRGQTNRSAGRFFSALLIMKPTRLLAAGWNFRYSEPENNRQAQALFQPMGYLFSPFAMWLPEVPAYRGKKKTIGLKLAERKRKCGFYPFKLMSTGQVENLSKRESSVLPYAEDFLQCVNHTPAKPWAYNPLTGSGWLKNLNQLEVSLRRLFSGQIFLKK